jgi:F-type H+-transporting ATPase subunit a
MHHVVDAESWHLPFFHWHHLPLGITLHTMMLLIAAAVLLVVFGVGYKKQSKVAPSGLTNLLELFVVFIRDEIVDPSFGHHKKDTQEMTPLFCSFFFFIMVLNFMGLIPLFVGATGNVNVTLGLASITFFFMLFGSIYKNGIGGFFKAFIPSGVPWPVLVLLVPIEMVGMVIKCVALTIRLFANMMAGHIVLFSLIGLTVTLGIAGSPGLLMAVALYFLKMLVCLLQAYIFTLLSALFIGQMYHPDH